MLNSLKAAAVALAVTVTGASATTQQFDVHANTHVWDDGTGNAGTLGLQTGITLTLGDIFGVRVNDVSDTWNFCVGGSLSSCEIDADGRRSNGSLYGTYTSGGYSNQYGRLVGRIDGGSFFDIGTAGFKGPADATGQLRLFHWDHNTNNGGTIAATVSYDVAPVPLPASLPLLLAALGATFYMRRRASA